MYKRQPEKSLLAPLNSKGGRNNNGRITTRHQGGGHKRAYRIIDFKRNKDGIPARVATIEYDPNRSANIALLNYADGEKRYICLLYTSMFRAPIVGYPAEVSMSTPHCATSISSK